MTLDPKFNESLGRNAIIEASNVWPDGVAGATFARTVIDGEDSLVIRCWAPNIRGTFAEFHYRSAERLEAAEAYETVIYGIAKLCLNERKTELTPEEFAFRLNGWKRDLAKDKRLTKVGLIPDDTGWNL